MTGIVEQIHLANTARWNALIPASAVRVQRDGQAVKYLHPTKGWRWVHKRRFYGADETFLPANQKVQ